MKENKEIKILMLSLTISGLISTTSGIVLSKINVEPKTSKIDVQVVEKKVAKIKSNVPILKDITVEVNEPISVDIKEYISNLDDISTDVLKAFKLDTSLVNVTQPGKYTYTIDYKDKKYTGKVIVKENEVLTNVSIQLKSLTFKLNSTLPTDINYYLETQVPPEVIQKMKLDISKVNVNVVGDYQYTITYNNMLYTGTIKVDEERPSQIRYDINYKIRYICGSTTVEDNKVFKNSNTKSFKLKINDIIKPDSLKECTAEIDTSMTNYSFPIDVKEGDILTIYYKKLTSTDTKDNIIQ